MSPTTADDFPLDLRFDNAIGETNLIRLPMGSSPGKYFWAKVWLTATTGLALAVVLGSEVAAGRKGGAGRAKKPGVATILPFARSSPFATGRPSIANESPSCWAESGKGQPPDNRLHARQRRQFGQKSVVELNLLQLGIRAVGQGHACRETSVRESKPGSIATPG